MLKYEHRSKQLADPCKVEACRLETVKGALICISLAMQCFQTKYHAAGSCWRMGNV